MGIKKGLLYGALALGSVGASAANAGINYAGNKALQEDAQQFNSAEAQKNRDFNEYLSSTEYQRAVADAYAAGINMAAVGTAGGASSPSSGAASSGMNSFNSGMANFFQSAMATAVASDKKVYDKVLTEMKAQSAQQVQQLRNAGRMAIEQYKNSHNSTGYRYHTDAPEGYSPTEGWEEL